MSENKEQNTTNLNWIVVGLGNPGAKYEDTRHNIGRDVVEAFKEAYMFPKWGFSNKANTLYSKGLVEGSSIELLKPETYMNLSGQTVAYAVSKHGLDTLNTIIVHDDLDIPFGEVKVSIGKGDGGNNGVKDIIKILGTNKFVRVRIGITPVHFGKERRPRGAAVERFVLKKFGVLERGKLPEILERASDAITEIIKNGSDSAMNKFN